MAAPHHGLGRLPNDVTGDDGGSAYEFGCSPGGFEADLRPQAQLVFVTFGRVRQNERAFTA
jgi:hypothetical protein